ncbi:MAG: DDE-type integrase/transposase/recombinase [Rhodobacterales bacterium]|nr:DDE-type integrase/transposase/recombinase [Rhodobacterales bacterium]
MRTRLVREALQRAVALRNPPPGLVHHTDRGSQYASADYRSDLDRIAVVPSMSRKGNCRDNAVSESFFGTLEQELAGRDPNWGNVDAVDAAVVDYIVSFYNMTRRHKTLGQVSPAVFEARWAEAQRSAAA